MLSPRKWSAIAASLLGSCSAAAAAAEEAWQQTVFVYGMGAAIDGDVTIGDITVPVDVSISELFDALEMGAMLAYRADNGTWSVTVDTTFMALGGTGRGPAGFVKGDVDIDQFTLMGTLGRRVTPNLEALLSLSYFDLSTDLKITGPLETRTASVDASWVDPMLGLQYTVPFAEAWRFNLRGDVGGFGVGSDFSYQLLTNFRWQANETFGVVAGYRVIGFDYEDGNRNGNKYQRFDLVEQGPLLGVTISF